MARGPRVGHPWSRGSHVGFDLAYVVLLVSLVSSKRKTFKRSFILAAILSVTRVGPSRIQKWEKFFFKRIFDRRKRDREREREKEREKHRDKEKKTIFFRIFGKRKTERQKDFQT